MLGRAGRPRGSPAPCLSLNRPLGVPGPDPPGIPEGPFRSGAGPPRRTGQALPLVPPRGAQASGGEKTTITRRSSLMWWNLCGTPAGT